MPRESADAQNMMALVPEALPPGPPASLTEDEAEVWREVAASKPADWWTPENYPVFEAYCHEVVLSRRLADLVNSLDVGSKEATQAIANKLAVDRSLASLATKMRLTQQSRWQPVTAARNAKKAQAQVKPWEKSA